VAERRRSPRPCPALLARRQKKPLGSATFADVGGATTNSLILSNLTATDNGEYRLVATNSFGSTASAPATLGVLIAPQIATQPVVAQTVVAPQSATFSVVATGSPTPTFQWSKNSQAILGATDAVYTIPSTTSADTGSYTVTVANSVSSITSDASLLTVNESAAIITQPVSQTIVEGQPVTFTVVASGIPSPTYQWKRGGTAITNATDASLTLPAVSRSDDGAVFSVTISNVVNTLTSSPATLPAPPR
jgi:hypothetical protein